MAPRVPENLVNGNGMYDEALSFAHIQGHFALFSPPDSKKSPVLASFNAYLHHPPIPFTPYENIFFRLFSTI